MSVLPRLDRALLGQVFSDPRLISAFEQMWETLEEAAATAASVSGSGGAIQRAPVLLTQANDAFSDARVLTSGTGMDVADADGLLTVSVSDEVPLVDGGFPVRFIVTEDTALLLPKTGRLATIAEVEGTVASMADGDKGDIVISDGGTVYTIDSSVNLTGIPTAATAAVGTNTTQLATTAFVRAEVTALVDSAPATLDTLNELAAALGDDPNFATTVTNALAAKQPLDADLTTLAVSITAAGHAMAAAADAQAQRVLLRNACMVRKMANETAADYSVSRAIAWDQEVYDDGGWHDNAVNNTRLIVPAGVTRVRVGGSVLIQALTASTDTLLSMLKNGLGTFDGSVYSRIPSPAGGGGAFISVASGPVPVTAGDYFELALLTTGDASVDITATRSNFWIEAA